MGKRVAKTRNCGTWSEARYWSQVRSALRWGFRFWKPIINAKIAARRPYNGPNKLQKWEYQCAICKKWFKALQVEVDHIVPVGSLTCVEDLPGFLERLTAEKGYRVLCKPCHKSITNKERNARKASKTTAKKNAAQNKRVAKPAAKRKIPATKTRKKRVATK